ncbi:unnamed protein product [Rotaria magnacalcarata]
MDRLVAHLKKDNRNEIENEFDYLFIFMYAHIIDRFPSNKQIYNVIEYNREDKNYYNARHKINETYTDIHIRKKLEEGIETITLGVLQILSEPIVLNDFVEKKKKLSVRYYSN